MATRSENNNLKELQAENRRLRQQNRELQQKASGRAGDPRDKTPLWRKLIVILSVALAVALLIAGNLLFWTGYTVVDNARFTQAVAPIIRNSEVQDALSQRISQRLLANVDVEKTLEDNLPPRLAFAAPAISDQVEQQTDNAIGKVLDRPQFQERWNTALQQSHQRFITAAGKYGSDGAIDISEVYSSASQQLKGTKLAFLADKPLPDKVGNIQLVEGGWLTNLERIINNIDTWRVIAILLLVLFTALGIWLSRNRRRTAVILALLWAAGMFLTAVSVRIAREMLADKADPAYAEAFRQAYSIFMHSFAVQTFTLMAAALAVAFIAWISGNSRSSRAVKARVDQLLSGKIHQAIFSRGENGFTLWLGRHKRVLEWVGVAIVAATALFIKLTPDVLLNQLVIIVLYVSLLEILAAPASASASPGRRTTEGS